MKEAREAMRALQFQDPFQGYREAMRAIQLQDPMKEAMEAMSALQLRDPLQGYREAMNTMQFQDPMKGVWGSMRALRLQDPFHGYREAMKTNQSSMRTISDGLKDLGIENIFGMISKNEWPLAHASADGGITVNTDNSVTLDFATLSYSEIEQVANDIAERTLNQSYERAEQVISTLVSEIRSLKNPPLEKLLSLYLYPIIVSLIFSLLNPITDYYIKEYLGVEKREIGKKIKKHVLASAKDSVTLDSYRLVTRNFLDIRDKPSARSSIIGRLYFCQVISIIDKQKDWSLVAWHDDEKGVAIQGWVFSRYLGKFR